MSVTFDYLANTSHTSVRERRPHKDIVIYVNGLSPGPNCSLLLQLFVSWCSLSNCIDTNRSIRTCFCVISACYWVNKIRCTGSITLQTGVSSIKSGNTSGSSPLGGSLVLNVHVDHSLYAPVQYTQIDHTQNYHHRLDNYQAAHNTPYPDCTQKSK